MPLIIGEIVLGFVLAVLIWHGIKDSRATPKYLRRYRMNARYPHAQGKARAQYCARATNAAADYDGEGVAINAIPGTSARAAPGGALVILALFVGAPIGVAVAIVAVGTVVKFLTGG